MLGCRMGTVDDLSRAAGKGDDQAVRRLIREGLDVNQFDSMGCTALQCAVASHRVECVRVLLEAGADVNTPHSNGCYLLHWACLIEFQLKECPLLESLIAYQARVDVRDRDGGTPLHTAVILGSGMLVRTLLRASADHTIKDNTGRTALDIAIEDGNDSLVRILARPEAGK